MGDSIEFPTGIVLPKSPDFSANPPPSLVDGRLAWTVRSGAASGSTAPVQLVMPALVGVPETSS
jgi:hypothetical protein